MSAKRVIDLSHRMADGTVTYPDAPLPSVVEGGGSEVTFGGAPRRATPV